MKACRKINGKIVVRLNFVLLLLTTGCSILGIRTVEEPEYQLLLSDGAFEIRHYKSQIVAKTKMVRNKDGEWETNDTFRKIAKYIFGDNQPAKEVPMTAPVVQENTGVPVAMTAPVVQENTGVPVAMTAPVVQDNVGASAAKPAPVIENTEDQTAFMYFVMPSKYSLQTLPVPLDSNIVIEEIPARKVAVVKFTGLVDEEKINQKTEELYTWLRGRNLTFESSPRSARYDPPWTVPLLRRNEVHVTVLD
jgi:hypothetical protein